MQTLTDLIEQAAQNFGDKPFLTLRDKSLSFKEIGERSRQLADAFSRRGIGKGNCVAIVLRNSPEFIITYFALTRLGAIAVPINFLVQKVHELEYMLKDCGAVGVVTQNEFLENLKSVKRNLSSLKYLWCTDYSEEGTENFWTFLNSKLSTHNPQLPTSSEDVVTILYTSGTTGSPKGVMLTHHNLLTNCEGALQLLNIIPDDVFLCILPMFHTFAWIACVLVPLKLGCKVVVLSSVTPAKPWLKLMAKHGVTLFPAVPPIYFVLSKEAVGFKRLLLKYYFFRKVRMGISGAAPLSVEVLKAFESKLGVPILEGYGLTETSPAVSINPLQHRKIGSVGKIIPGVAVKILDEEGRELPTMDEGEICVRGPNVMKGYYNKPEATQEAITPDGWLKTGDIGALDAEGYLYVRDRKKDMIIIKGLKVFPAQIEAILLTHPAIEEAAVVGIPSEDGEEIIKAYCVLKKGVHLEKSELMHFMKEKFDPYKRPRDVEFLDALPKNALQKILKRVLKQKEIEKQKSIKSTIS
ncbi:MAG: long-chain fatty acid--CoA ligase [Elusimicrobia bacterium]|nr:long-chain fatty acid--CoA ligase [Elusimicrobiota bacterium]